MSNYNIESLHFLIVDDNMMMRRLLRSIFHSFGVRHLKEAGDGAEAFRSLATFPADVIVVDWRMEPVDGLKFTRLIRTGEDSPDPFVPILMLTGNTEKQRVFEARDAGVTEFLAKPVSARKLYDRITSMIERPRFFIRSATYFGPDRRRRDDPDYTGPERRRDRMAGMHKKSDIDEVPEIELR